jgi:uncharacterized membrane protein YeaQ/YmgE (transglycosylase-associated protein family)
MVCRVMKSYNWMHREAWVLMDGIISFIGWLIIGAIIGWIAGKLWVGHGFGLLGNILVGIAGSFIGGFLFGWIFGTTGIGGWISAILGAVVLLIIVGLIKK